MEAIHVQPIGGLCNRLRVIGSYLGAARRAGVPLHVWWIPHSACPTTFAELFEMPIAVDCIMHDTAIGPAQKIVTCYVCPDISENDWAGLVLESFRPVAAIRERIAAVLEELGTGFTAVHIRRTDHNSNYDQDQAFVDFAGAGSGAVFVAADNPRSIATLKKAMGDRVFYAVRFAQRGIRLSSVADAVVDLWVAGRAARFKGTYWSSFSEWIELLRGIYGSGATGDLAPIDGITKTPIVAR